MRTSIEESWERPVLAEGQADLQIAEDGSERRGGVVYAHRIQPNRVTAGYASTATAIRDSASNRRPTVQTSGVWRAGTADLG
jgi:hypothetical protein